MSEARETGGGAGQLIYDREGHEIRDANGRVLAHIMHPCPIHSDDDGTVAAEMHALGDLFASAPILAAQSARLEEAERSKMNKRDLVVNFVRDSIDRGLIPRVGPFHIHEIHGLLIRERGRVVSFSTTRNAVLEMAASGELEEHPCRRRGGIYYRIAARTTPSEEASP